MMLWRASEVVLMIETSLETTRDSVWCFGGIGGISEHNGLMSGVGGDWGGGKGLRHEVGRLGLGARQFGESERLGGLCGGSLCGGGSLQPSEWLGLDRFDLWEVPLLSR